MRNAYFAGGCFWCITPVFTELDGVKSVISGYSGGLEVNPSYEDVKKQLTSHRETIKIEYDVNKISYETLLNEFLNNVDVFDGEGQYIDRGRSYTLAVYYETKEECDAAKAQLDGLKKKYNKEIYVSLEPFKMFFEAEEYHQMFYLKNPEEFLEEMIKSGRKK